MTNDNVDLPSVTTTFTERSHRCHAIDIAENQMTTAFQQLTNALGSRESELRPVKEDDDSDLYAKLLAKKLREPNNQRKHMMYQIDGLFINRSIIVHSYIIHDIILDHQFLVLVFINANLFSLSIFTHF